MGMASEKENDYNRKLVLAHELMLHMGLKNSSAELFEFITKGMINIFGANGSAVYLYSPKLEELTLVTVHNLRESLIGVKVNADQGLLGQVVKSLKAMKIDDYRVWPERVKVFEEDQYRALLEAPIIWKTRLFGVIGLVRTGDARPFNDFDLNLLSIIAIQMASTMSHLES